MNGATREYVKHTSAGTSGSGGRSWTFTWQAPSTNVDTITFYAIINAANGNNNQSGDQIYAKEFKIAPSSLLPTAIIQTSKSVVCSGDTMTLYGAGTNNPTSYRWKFHTGFPQTVSTQNVVRTYTNLGNFSDTLWVTNNKGESLPTRVLTQVVAKPSANITAVTPNDTACMGDSIMLSCNTGNGFHYSWDTGNPADTFSTVYVKQSGSYRVTITNSNGCSRESNPVTLHFMNPPTPTLQTNPVANTICEGDTLKFQVAGGSFLNYDYYDGTTLIQSGPSQYLEITAVGVYQITAVVDNGFCTATTPAIPQRSILAKMPAPQLVCGQATTDEVNFHWNPVSGATGYEYSINNGTFQATTDTFLNIGGLNFNTNVGLQVRATSGQACSPGKIGTGTCKSLPCSQFTYDLVLSDSVVCEEDTVIIDVLNISLSKFSIEFNGIPVGTQTAYRFPAVYSDPYFEISILDSMSPGCPAFVIYDSIEVFQKPELKIGLSDTAICPNTPLTVHASGGFDTYEFYLLNTTGSIGVLTDSSFTFTSIEANERFRVKAKTSECTVNSDTVDLSIYVPREAGFTFTGSNRIWTFTDTTTLTQSRIWNWTDGSASDTAKVITHEFPENNNYAVNMYLLDNNGCGDTTFNMVQTDNVGIQNQGDNALKIYPNPNKGKFVIESQSAILHLRIFGMDGKIVVDKPVDEQKMLELKHDLPPGTYLIKISTFARDTIYTMVVE